MWKETKKDIPEEAELVLGYRSKSGYCLFFYTIDFDNPDEKTWEVVDGDATSVEVNPPEFWTELPEPPGDWEEGK